jgi:hypothetical protein
MTTSISGVEVKFTESSTGTLSGNTITVHGTWTNTTYGTTTFIVVATKK